MRLVLTRERNLVLDVCIMHGNGTQYPAVPSHWPPTSVQQGGRVWKLWLEIQNLLLSRAELNGGKAGELGKGHLNSLQEEGEK